MQNISRARNQLVCNARGAWLAFVDDDEIPSERWLVELWNVAKKFPSVIVKGPVLRRLPERAPRWLVALPYAGSELPAAGTSLPPRRLSGGNILVLRTALIQVSGKQGPFDEEFGLRGGEYMPEIET